MDLLGFDVGYVTLSPPDLVLGVSAAWLGLIKCSQSSEPLFFLINLGFAQGNGKLFPCPLPLQVSSSPSLDLLTLGT